MSECFETIQHEVDVCVVGGGMAGLIASVSAARHGARVVLMQDRPMLGGNASSEIRMWICGARGAEAKETGLLEEIMLRNYYRNRTMKYTIWDTVLFETARYQPGLTLLLNCACSQVCCEGNVIQSVKGWQTTTQQFHQVNAFLFIDCSGDSVLRSCGADHRQGRESRFEYGESHAPEEADSHTMGNTILIQTREVDEHVPFIPPEWAYKYTEDDLPNRYLTPTGENFWWLEVGGMENTIRDAEKLRDELLKIAFGVWSLIKNHPDSRAKKWELEWIGALPGKRESVRYLGDHVLTQSDVLAGGMFDDVIAYGGWEMDDHHPGGLYYRGSAAVFHDTPSPYGIPYRSLYSRNIENLMFAGRNISASHMAMSSTRVMGTCSLLGQAAGTAAAIARKHACTPRDVYQHHLTELQATLLDDDIYLPGKTRLIPDLSRRAALSSSVGNDNIENLRNGIQRDLNGEDHGWWAGPGGQATYHFDNPVRLQRVRLVFDSDLSLTKRMPCWYPKSGTQVQMPDMLPRSFNIEARTPAGRWEIIKRIDENHARLVKVPLDIEATALRFTLLESWGSGCAHLMEFDVR